MKRLVTILGITWIGCATFQGGDELRMATLKSFGAERVAWLTNNTAALPSGMESVVSLKTVQAYIDNIAVQGSEGIVTATWRYTGTFSTPQGQRAGTLTVQRRLHFTRGDRGSWTQSAAQEEIARNASWSSGRTAS